MQQAHQQTPPTPAAPRAGASLRASAPGAPAGRAAQPASADSARVLCRSELAGVIADPAAWYVNVPNASFPAGAIRGQLR